MSSAYTPANLGEGAIKRCILRLADKYPFHACVLERFRLVASPPVGTIGVTASQSGILLLFNPDFVLNLPPNQLGGVLLHEVHHLVFDHLLIDQAKYQDPWALTVALEVTANEFIREPLPPGGIMLRQFPMLPPMESFGQRYRRLVHVRPRPAIASLPMGAAGGGIRNLKDDSSGGDSLEGAAPVVFDNHGVWQEALKNPQAVRQILDDLIHEAELEAGGMPQKLLDALGIGTLTDKTKRFLQSGRQGQLDWRQLLRHYLGQVLQPRPVFYRPPRRFPNLVGILPGQRYSPVQPSIVAVIDTSASITSEALEEIDGELRRLSRIHIVQVVECDCEIKRVAPYKGRLELVTGQGGTDFRPPLVPSFLRRLKADLVIYFTDGHGPAPVSQPPCPVIWCLLPGGEAPAPWGRVVRMRPPA
jgi:predicted metal-dependent peptidase